MHLVLILWKLFSVKGVPVDIQVGHKEVVEEDIPLRKEAEAEVLVAVEEVDSVSALLKHLDALQDHQDHPDSQDKMEVGLNIWYKKYSL